MLTKPSRIVAKIATFAITSLIIAAPARAQSDLEQGFAGALRGCEEWVLKPKNWIDGFRPFAKAVGLGDKMALVDDIDELAKPPQALRAANHYWRINATVGAGYILVVSDRLPMCHITGGGTADLQPAVEAVLASPDFAKRWEHRRDQSHDDMISSEYVSREAPEFSILISRAKLPGQRLDRVQVLASALFSLKQ